jgi:hypothetical protein
MFAPTSSGDPDDNWLNAAAAYSSDGAYASTSSSVAQAYDTFGFSIPGNNEIIGLIVTLEASASTDAGTIEVALSWDGGTTFTSVQSTPTLTTTDVVYELGASDDQWGRTWTVAEFNNTNFRLRITGNSGGNLLRVDAIAVQPVHQSTGGGGGAGGRI